VEDLYRTISTETPYLLVLLEVCHFLLFSLKTRLIVTAFKDLGVIKAVKNVADGKGKHADNIRDNARTAYEQWVTRVQEIHDKPRWKWTPKPGPKLGVEVFVLKRV